MFGSLLFSGVTMEGEAWGGGGVRVDRVADKIATS